ncbi:MAG: hypothetical protein Q8S41_02930 [Lutibacter sp.]|nr:hypothetical protein [Lutibacter sp.]
MARFQLKVCVFGFLLLFSTFAKAQGKELIISKELAENSEMLKVKMGAQWMGKIWKFKFGDYAVVDSKMGWGKVKSKSNLLNTKSEVNSNQKFSFVLTNKTNDSAIVNAEKNISIKEIQSFELFPNFYWGSDELLKDSRKFSAFISTTSNPEETWVLVMKTTQGSEVDYENEAFLTNGERLIAIVPVNSEKDTKNRSELGMILNLPAMGYEFIENDQSLCAMQYYGGGVLGRNKNIIWLKSDLDARMKLIYAAAMTAIMQISQI